MDTVVLVGRLLVSLAVVLGVLWLIARRANRRGGGRRRQSPIEVLGRQQLGRHSGVAVVRVAGQTLILGVTDGAVSLLTTADLDDAAAAVAEDGAGRVDRDREREIRLPVREEAVAALSRTTTAPSHRRTKAGPPSDRSALSGSALSPGTWRQTVDALRDLTARTG
jgi:flagellar protein FliO/FliZ